MNQIRSVSVRMDADVASYVAKMKLAGRETEKAFDGASINSRRLNSDLQATEQRLDRVSQAERQVESSTRSASTQLRSMDNDVVRLNRDLDRGGNALDSYSGRVSLLAQAGAVLGPALLPIGAVAVPALTGLATAATAGAVAGGTLLTAMVGVGDAVQAMNDQALDPSRANMEKLRAAMDQLGPEARHFVREFAAFRPVLSDIRDSAAAGWFPGLIESLDDFEGLAPRVADMFEDIGEAGGRMVAETAESFNSQRWIPFLNFVAAELPSALTSLGRIVGDLTHGAAEMWMSFDPANDQFLSWLEGVANGFDNWASSASGREDIAAFVPSDGAVPGLVPCGAANGVFSTAGCLADGVRAAREALDPSMGALEIERAALRAFLEFAAEHKEIYRIIDEAEFVDPDSYRMHYETIGARIEERLRQGGDSGEFVPGLGTPEAWALMGMNVFLGLRYVIWGREGDPDFTEIARRANILLTQGIGR